MTYKKLATVKTLVSQCPFLTNDDAALAWPTACIISLESLLLLLNLLFWRSPLKKIIPSALVIASGLNFTACRASNPEGAKLSAESNSNSGSFSSNPAEVFGLASYVKNSIALIKLHPYVGPGAAYLFFGEEDKFRVQSNLTVEARGGSAIVGGGDRYIRTAYFLDAFAFGRPLADGDAVDIEAKADLNTMKLNVSVRALGNTLYQNEITTGYNQTFTRDFEYKNQASVSSLGIPIPGLGVTITGKIGGEVGLRAAPGLRGDGAIAASFEPNIALHGSLAGGLTAFKFASVEARGTAMIMDFRVSGSANLGYSPFNNFIYGDAGFDGGSIKALDGKLELLAAADLGGALPEGVAPVLWQLLGSSVERKEWKHTLWDPELVYSSKIPSRGASFMKYLKTPENCVEASAKTKENLLSRMAKLEGQKDTFVDQEAIVLESSIKALASVMTQLDAFCSKATAAGEDANTSRATRF